MLSPTSDRRLPEVARACLAALGVQLRMLKAQILEFDRQVMAWHRSNETSKRLDEIPGVGPALATALVFDFLSDMSFLLARCRPRQLTAFMPPVEGSALSREMEEERRLLPALQRTLARRS
jgi:hypothetical protein